MPSLPISETTRVLVLAAKRGDRDAAETLVLRHRPVRGIVEKIKRECDPNRIARGWEPKPGPGTPDESEAAARLGVLDALNRYDPDRGVAFTTFAYPFIKGAVLTALYPKVLRRAGADRPIPRLVALDAGLDQAPDARSPGFEAQMLDRDPSYGQESGYRRALVADQRAEIYTFVCGLPASQRDVVREIYWEGRSQTDVAARRGVSHQAISKLVNKAHARGRAQFDSVDLVAA